MVLAVMLVLILSVTTAAADPGPTSASYDLSWDVIGNGGTTMSSGSFTMMSTTGQAVTGEASSANITLLSGYWQGATDFIREVLLPIIVKSLP
jgi:hypothetical protein